jgi:septal ring factor EnvC (AmiA/AmiB activator)
MAEPPPSFTDPSKDNANFTLEFNTNDQEFTDINIEFERVLTSLSNDDQMTKFRQEYEKMFRALVHSRDNTAKFLKQHALLESEFSSNIDSVHTTVQASAEDQETINGLRDTIKSIQKGLVDSAYKEESGKEQLRVLRGDISSLVTTVKQGLPL